MNFPPGADRRHLLPPFAVTAAIVLVALAALTAPDLQHSILPVPVPASAQLDESAPTLYLHIPAKMIAGQTYHGIAVSSEPAGLFHSGDNSVHLASGSPSIMLPSTSVEIPVGKNHAVFEIHALQSGAAEVHAAYGGLVGLAHGTVYSQATGPHKLDIITTGGLTSASDLPAFIYLMDTNGYPARAPAGGVDVRLVGGGLVEAPRSITIPAGSAQALVPLRVSGTGHVSAAAPGLMGDTEHLSYDRDAMHVRLEVSPDIVLPGGKVYYSVWLERDPVNSGSDILQDESGTESAGAPVEDAPTLPYHPPRAIAAELQTTNTDVLRLTESHPPNKKEGRYSPITLHGGRAAGVLYAGHGDGVLPASSLHSGDRTSPAGPSAGGIAVLTVSVPGYGVASAHVCVGTVVTSSTTAAAYDTNSTSVVEGSDGNYLIVTGSGGGGDRQQQQQQQGDGDGQQQDAQQDDSLTNRSCGSGTETWAAYVDRIIRASVASSTQSGGNTDGSTIQFPRETYGPPEPNNIRLFMQPSTVTPLQPHSGTQGVVGFYRVDVQEPEQASFTDGDLTIVTSTEYERVTPVRAEYESITITASSAPGSERGGGGIDVRPHHVSHPTFHTNAYAFPIQANLEGTYSVQAASGGHVQNATLRVVHPYETAYHLHVTELPARGPVGEEQPLFMVGLVDDAGRIIDVLEEFGEPRTVMASFGDRSDPSAAHITVRDAEIGSYNTAVISGPVPGPGGTGAVITLEGWPPASGPYEGTVVPVDAPVRMEMDAPRMVHVGERFPVTTHTVDQAGIPVALVDEDDRRDTGFEVEGGTGLVETGGPQYLSSLYEVGGAVREQVVAFLNRMSVDVGGLDKKGPDEMQVPVDVKAGEPFEIRADTLTEKRSSQSEQQQDLFGVALDGFDIGLDLDGLAPGGFGFSSDPLPVPDVAYEIDAPPGWPVDETSPGVFVITPADEGEFIITVSGSKEGFYSKPATIFIRSEMSVPLTVDAVVPSHDSRVSVPFTLQNGTTVTTPYQTILSSPTDVSFAFPESFEGGYGLVDTVYEGGTLLPGGTVRISAYDRTVNVTAVYDRQVEIIVLGTGSTGSGAYQYGQTVVASATPGHVIPYLIPEKIAYWQGVPGTGGVLPTDDVISFRAESDAVIEPVFEPDYMRLYMVVAAAAAAGGFIAYRRFGAALAYKIGDLVDSVRGGSDGDDDDDDGGGGTGDDDGGGEDSGYNAAGNPDGYDDAAYRDTGSYGGGADADGGGADATGPEDGRR
ncbi:MAG: hypothetical protein OXK17_05160 [Thaumarchaeota archaeon]|nr:hypothetical protein [Nitrososphaerota archaeon]